MAGALVDDLALALGEVLTGAFSIGLLAALLALGALAVGAAVAAEALRAGLAAEVEAALAAGELDFFLVAEGAEATSDPADLRLIFFTMFPHWRPCNQAHSHLIASSCFAAGRALRS